MEAALVAVRSVHLAATIILAGILLYLPAIGEPAFLAGGGTASGASKLVARIRRRAHVCLALAIASATAWVMLEASGMSGLPLAAAVRGGVIWTVLTRTTFGLASDVRFALLLVLALLLAGVGPRRATDVLAALLGLAALGSIAWTGHAAASDGYLHRGADVLHLLAAGVWIGGLVPLVMLLATARREKGETWARVACVATVRFSTAGIAAVAGLLATGIVNTWFLAGSLPALLGTAYGRVLLAKIALFGIMVAVAATNRLRLTPRLFAAPDGPSQRSGLRQLTRNARIEVVLGLAVLAVVGALGTLVPGLHAEPDWPLPIRLPGGGADYVGAVAALAATLFGIGLVLSAPLVRPPWRLATTGSGAVLAVYCGWVLARLLVPAYPTTFWASPAGYDASSVARGRQAYAEHCAVCHGPRGRGNGAAGAGLATKPADLTREHIYAHTDGDLFWWITHGIGEAMPAFDGDLDATTRWDMIDFVHANADAVRLSAAPGKVSPTGYPVPDVSADCVDGSSIAIDDLRGRVVHIVLSASASADRIASLAARDRSRGVYSLLVTSVEAASPADGVCVATDPIAFTGLSLYGSGTGGGDGTEMLVDPAGSIRSVWHPGVQPAWTDAAAFKRLVDAIRSAPVPPRSTGAGHAHH